MFFNNSSATDENFIHLRDSDKPFIVEARQFVETMWPLVSPFLDSDLPDRAASSFLPCFWEMYLAHAVRLAGIDLVRRADRTPSKRGPDLLAANPGVWIEAVAPTSGEGRDSVPDLAGKGVQSVPDKQVKLRLRQAMEEKAERLASHIERGWVKPAEPTIITVSGARIQAAMFEATIPRIIRCVLPIGDEAFHIDTVTTEVVGRSFAYSPDIRKQSGSDVSTEVFANPAYNHISAVLYSRANGLNQTATPGHEFVLCHNPAAKAPLPRGWLAVGSEFWVEGDQLHRHDHTGDGA